MVGRLRERERASSEGGGGDSLFSLQFATPAPLFSRPFGVRAKLGSLIEERGLVFGSLFGALVKRVGTVPMAPCSFPVRETVGGGESGSFKKPAGLVKEPGGGGLFVLFSFFSKKKREKGYSPFFLFPPLLISSGDINLYELRAPLGRLPERGLCLL